MVSRISWNDIAQELEIDTVEFPKYARPLLNLANQYAQATRPPVVGQMSELIEEFPGDCVHEWEEWYSERMPEAMNEAVDRIEVKIKAFREVLDQVDRETTARWVRDLVICKTYQGMRFQAAVLKHVAAKTSNEWTRATLQEEARGIDGHIGSTPVSIKPETYEAMKQLQEEIGVAMIVYRKTRRHLEVEFDPDDFR